jgi:transposase-like protein
MPKHTNSVLKAQAELAYIVEGKRIPDIAATIGITEATIRNWRKQGNWDERRKAKLMSSSMVASELIDHIARISESAKISNRPLTAAEIDSIAKLQSTVRQLNKGAQFMSNALEALEKFNAWLAAKDPDLQRQLVPHFSEFAHHLATLYSA